MLSLKHTQRMNTWTFFYNGWHLHGNCLHMARLNQWLGGYRLPSVYIYWLCRLSVYACEWECVWCSSSNKMTKFQFTLEQRWTWATRRRAVSARLFEKEWIKWTAHKAALKIRSRSPFTFKMRMNKRSLTRLSALRSFECREYWIPQMKLCVRFTLLRILVFSAAFRWPTVDYELVFYYWLTLLKSSVASTKCRTQLKLLVLRFIQWSPILQFFRELHVFPCTWSRQWFMSISVDRLYAVGVAINNVIYIFLFNCFEFYDWTALTKTLVASCSISCNLPCTLYLWKKGTGRNSVVVVVDVVVRKFKRFFSDGFENNNITLYKCTHAFCADWLVHSQCGNTVNALTFVVHSLSFWHLLKVSAGMRRILCGQISFTSIAFVSCCMRRTLFHFVSFTMASA